MLVAYTEDRKRISLIRGWKKEQLENLRLNHRFVCPVCKAPVRLKLGSKRRWHFSHYGEVKCSIELEAESDYHLLGKEQLYDWIISQHIQALLEPYLSSIHQRPDILVHYDGRYYAIEYQCSPIPLTAFEKRTNGYLQEDIIPIWVFGGNRMTRKSSSLFSLSPIEWAAVQPHVKLNNFLHYYCSDTKQFFSLMNSKSLSSQSALSHLVTRKIREAPFQTIIKGEFSLGQSSNELWLTIKKKWRYSVTPYPNRLQQFFNEYCLQRKISPLLYPIEAGWPTKNHQWIETSPYIWQTLILIHLSTYAIETHVTFKDVYRFIKELIERGVCSTRTLTYFDGHYSYAIMSYLQLLVQCGVIRRTNTKKFFRVKDVQFPQSIDEAIVRDEAFANRYKIN
ncbi:MAG: hypothetical protein LPK26_03000 [Bacillaceae bacterium]|nr:hypothetical protein [Bacillaceae bacterium]